MVMEMFSENNLEMGKHRCRGQRKMFHPEWTSAMELLTHEQLKEAMGAERERKRREGASGGSPQQVRAMEKKRQEPNELSKAQCWGQL